jgi:hypothetical protein
MGSLCRGGLQYFPVISVSRKRGRKGNPVVSDETVMYGYESSVTLTTDRLHYKLQTRPLVREGAQDEEQSNCLAKETSGHGPQGPKSSLRGNSNIMIVSTYTQTIMSIKLTRYCPAEHNAM